MSEYLGWLIALKGWEQMITKPRPHYAHTEAELRWWLENYGPADKYDITRVPDPLAAMRPELERQRLAELAKSQGNPDS
jgi:hypothetical protein